MGQNFCVRGQNRSWIVEGVAGVVLRNYLLLTTSRLATARHSPLFPLTTMFLLRLIEESRLRLLLYINITFISFRALLT